MDIDIFNYGGIYVRDRPVVVEVVVVPIAAVVAVTHITVAIVDAAVIADVRTPIAMIPAIVGIGPAPVAWRPKCTDIGGDDPHPGHPIISGWLVVPVAWRPDVV